MINSEFEKFPQSQDAIVSQPLEVLLRYLKQDGYRLHDLKHADCMRVQDELDSIQKGHSENYFEGIQPVFSSVSKAAPERLKALPKPLRYRSLPQNSTPT
jgi:3-oxoacyl-ACP reductase-like protein